VRVTALSDSEGLIRLPVRTGSLWESDTQPRSTGVDGHIWLDPNNGIAIARAAARALGKADPEHARLYAANAEAFAERTMLFDARLALQLEPLRGRPYIVFHDAYQYFDAHCGLTPVGAVAVPPGGQPDERRIEELHEKINSSGAICVLSTPKISPQLVETLTEGTQARIAVIEDLGANIPSGPTLYQTLLTRIAATLVSCLGS
jgi:zinc transport system substrate-binding protein